VIEGLHFADEQVLYALALLPALVVLYLWARLRSARNARAFGAPGWRAVSAGGALRMLLLLLGLGAAILAAARPQWGTEPLPVARRGTDVMVALDVSRSMAVEDVAPNRLFASTAFVKQLMDSLTGDRVGLVVYGSTARLRFPLTTDFSVAGQILDTLTPGTPLVEPGSAIAPAVTLALEQLASSEAASKVLVVIGDGEEVSSTGALPVDLPDNLVVFVAGIGSAGGGTIPVLDRTTGALEPKLDAAGQPIVSALDEASLREVAGALGGRYVPLASTNASSLAAEIGRLRASVFAEATEERPVERFQYFAAAAAALLVAWALVPAGRLSFRGLRSRRATLALALLAIGLAACTSSAAFRLNDEANDLFVEGSYDDALARYQEAQFEDPTLTELNYNAANALHRLDDYQAAIAEARRGTAAGGEPAARSFYTIGNSLFELGRLEEAADAYRDALRRDPTDEDARYNLEVVLRLLQEAEEETPPDGGEGPGEGSPSPETTGTATATTEGGSPGAGTPPPPGEGTPAPGQPEPGEGTPAPPGATSTADAPPSDNQLALEQNDALLEQALQEFEDGVTVEEALRVLDLLDERERLRLEEILSGGGGSGDPLDY
jgi:Ca-activated chloride channel family protein